MSLHPSLLGLYQDGSQQVNIGAYWSRLVSGNHSKTDLLIQLGAWYRINDSLIALTGMQVNQLKIGISYDFNSSVFNENVVVIQAQNAFEVSISYDFNAGNRLNKVLNPLF